MLSFFSACAQSEEGILQLSPEKFISNLNADTNAVLIDVRTPQEYKQGHIKNAVNIDVLDTAAFASQTESLDKSKTVYLYCRSGRRSNNAARDLVSRGFNCVDMKGGILAYKGELVK